MFIKHTERLQGLSLGCIHARSTLAVVANCDHNQNAASASKAPWSNEYYVSFGHGDTRDREEARKYGFICGGGGTWYSKTLSMLKEGDRVWVNIPKTGYVEVAEVCGPTQRFSEFEVEVDGVRKHFADIANADYHKRFADDEVNAEYMVPVKWLVSVPAKDAVSEVGFFGNQNTVARPTTTKWPHTIERLKKRWNIQKSGGLSFAMWRCWRLLAAKRVACLPLISMLTCINGKIL